MRSASLVCGIAFLALSTMGFQCAGSTRVAIDSPGLVVDEFSFPIEFELIGDVLPETLEVTINHVDILDRVSGGPALYSAAIAPGAPLRNHNILKIRVKRASNGKWVHGLRLFAYIPPGKASAKRIEWDSQRIRGPLAHSRVGDYLLQNGVARFAIQDVGQRELYSVGQYGGNLIDAELVADPGKDNFLELQPGLNIETVINAQEAEIVNDGQDGTAAIIRTCGPDDLLDFVNPSSQIADLGIPGIVFPASADDNDLEIEGCNEYVLEPGDSHVRIDTEVFNNEAVDLALPVGDWLNPSGELDTFARPVSPGTAFDIAANGVGPSTTSNLGTLGFVGFDEAAGVDYAYTQTPFPSFPGNGSFVFISGVLVVLHSQNVLLTLIGLDPIRFNVLSGGSNTFTRYFGVGDGSGSNAVDLENIVRGLPSGEISGCVSVAGVPVAGARVSVGAPFATGLPFDNAGTDNIASNFTTRPGACPNYSGTIQEGSYEAAAALDGHLYEGGGASPLIKPVTIANGTPASLDFALPSAGSLRVVVTDEGGSPIPARVTVVGFDPSPEPRIAGPELPGFGGGPLGLFNDISDRLPFGVTAVGYADQTGSVAFDLEPGIGLYQVFVSRGTEYSVFQTAAIDVSAGSETVVNAQIARVLDTPGFVSSDFHVHGIRSADSRVSDIHRIESYSCEGVENLIMTDHHVHTDIGSVIDDAGMGDFLTTTVGEEITSFDYGHFNAYPFLLDPDSPHATTSADGLTQLSGGSTDWAQAAPPGMDFPIYGALNATPSEIYDLARFGDLSIPGVTTIQVNHIGSHYGPLKIDTSLVPPADGMSDADRAIRRLPDTATVPNLFHHFPALELWNGDDGGAQGNFLNERIGVWFNHLNQGMRTTFIADTDSHKFTNLNSAGARTWTASPTDLPSEIDPADVAASVDAGRAVGGQGIYVQTRLVATDGSGDVADLSWGGDTEMTDAGGNVNLEIEIQSPSWAPWDTVEIYANAATVPAGAFSFGAIPNLTLSEGDCVASTTGDGDFDVSVTTGIGGVAGADRHSATLSVPFAGLTEETWFVAVVRGSGAQCDAMFPMYPDDLDQGTNGTLADLVDGNAGEGGVTALGASNALYFIP